MPGRQATTTASSPFSMRHIHRRAVLQAGVSTLAGLSSGASVEAVTSGSVNAKPAKACIFLFMWGGPSQLDTLDMKPDAPAEVRGDFKPASTTVPGLQICEHFQHLAQLMDKVAVIRSLTHNDPAHLSSAHATLTGHLARVRPSDAEPPNETDAPHLGSVLAHLRDQNRFKGFAGAESSLPGFVTMPWKAYHPAAPGGQPPGQHGGWLGRTFDPFLLTGDPNAANWSIPALQLLDGTSAGRLTSRQQLLSTIERQQRSLAESGAGRTMTSHQAKAVDFLTSQKVRQAFDLKHESAETRDRYGRNIHGQSVLLARRLVEHGVPMVSVNWHNDGQNFWDTHGNNFNRLKNDLLPPSDRALSALLDDLNERGLLGETLIAWVGEFGRRPTITAGNAGREHWPNCYSGILAGGGIRGGAVFGASDAQGAYPAESPVSPQDYVATMLRALGIPQNAALRDRQQRPHRVYAGMPIDSLF